MLLGFGFLSFEDEDSVDRCVAEHFVNLNGKQVIYACFQCICEK